MTDRYTKEQLPIVKVIRVSDLKTISTPTAGEIEHYGKKKEQAK